MRLRNLTTLGLLILLLAAVLLVSSAAGAEVVSGQSTTVTLVVDEVDVEPPVVEEIISRVLIDASDDVKDMGYMVNLQKNISSMEISGKQDTHISIMLLGSLEEGKTLSITLTYVNKTDVLVERKWNRHPFEMMIDAHGKSTDFRFNLSIVDKNPVTPPSDEDPEDLENTTDPWSPNTPSEPDIPTLPDLPEVPDTPVKPDTPGSDEPYTPILPPAGSVYNFAGFIPLLAGFLLLFLLLFMRGNLVYRTLKKHAKEHGEKPDKEEKKRLKEIASAIVSRIRDDEKYPEWKKNTDVMKHLGVDICLLLDEMKYREAVPREALVTEILEKARGKINRHRL